VAVRLLTVGAGDPRRVPVADLAFLALTVVCFALLVALVRGMEKL